MDNYRRPIDVVFPTPGPAPEYVRKATIRRIIQQQQQQERIEREDNTPENCSQNNSNNNNVTLQQEENGDRTVTTTKTPTTSSEINGIDHSIKINGHFNAQEINNGDKMSIDHKEEESKDSLNSNENISNNKNNNESTQEIISSSQDQGSLNKEPINPEPPPEPPDDENGESSNNKKDSGKSILKSQNDDKEGEEEESSDDSLPDEETLVNKLEELTTKKKQLWQQLRDAKAKQAKKEQVVTNNESINNNLREETSTNYNTGMHDQSYKVDRHNIQPTSYISSNRDHYDTNYLPSYHHHEGDNTAFHHQLPFGIKRMNEQTSPLGQMNKRMRHPPNGMHYDGAPSMYGPPPTGPSSMTGNGMMGRGRDDPYPYYHRNEFRPPPPTAPYLDRYGRGSINNMQRRLSGNPPNRPAVRPPDRPRGRY